MSDERDGAPPGLDGLYADRRPSPELEERIVGAYAARPGPARAANAGTEGPSGALSIARAWLSVAAGLVLVLIGYGAGRLLPATGGTVADPGREITAEPRPGYLLLLWEDASFAREAPPGGFAEEYSAWARSVASSGVPISGYELGDDRAVIGADAIGDVSARDRASERGEGWVSGYFVVGVDALADARRLAEGHPHVSHGGWIEVAQMR